MFLALKALLFSWAMLLPGMENSRTGSIQQWQELERGHVFWGKRNTNMEICKHTAHTPKRQEAQERLRFYFFVFLKLLQGMLGRWWSLKTLLSWHGEHSFDLCLDTGGLSAVGAEWGLCCRCVTSTHFFPSPLLEWLISKYAVLSTNIFYKSEHHTA